MPMNWSEILAATPILAVVGDEWIVARLNMGHRSNVSRAVSAYREPQAAERRKLLKILHTCTD
jgi:hypothetical protein